MIAVVDYRKGNLKSVERGLIAAGGDVLVTDDAAAIARAEAIVLPGVGAFADASATMWALGQMDVIHRRIAAGVPFLGICLGLHLMFEEGVEGSPGEDDERSTNNACGLAILPGVATKIPSTDQKGNLYKVPHVGWNTVVLPACRPPELFETSAFPGNQASCDAGSLRSEARGVSAIPRILGTDKALVDSSEPMGFSCPLLKNIPSGAYFYFTHSFIAPSGPFIVGETTHSVTFPSAVQYGDVAFGLQFHPEKSSDAGAAVLRNFVEIVKGA